MEGVFKDGDVERADVHSETGCVWYIPYQGVYHPKKPEKITAVFDCSAKYEGTALNNHLLTGPDFTDGLTSVESVNVAIDLVREAQTVCARRKLQLHKFISNSREVLESMCVGPCC